jgi:hypothetical protein
MRFDELPVHAGDSELAGEAPRPLLSPELDALHQYDCLRSNKAMMDWGVEARVRFFRYGISGCSDEHRRRAQDDQAGPHRKGDIARGFRWLPPTVLPEMEPTLSFSLRDTKQISIREMQPLVAKLIVKR